VLLLTAIEDVQTLFGFDEKEYPEPAAVRHPLTGSGFAETSGMADAHHR
jgi:hypothetical protein